MGKKKGRKTGNARKAVLPWENPKKTAVFILLDEGEDFAPGNRDKTYAVGCIEGLDWANLPRERLIEVTQDNAHQFPALHCKQWVADNGKGCVSLLLAHHTEDTRELGLATFALSDIPQGTAFPYAGEEKAYKDVDPALDSDLLKLASGKVISPYALNNGTLYFQYVPSLCERKTLTFNGELAVANLTNSGGDFSKPALRTNRPITKGQMLGWNYDGAGQRKTYLEMAFKASPGFRFGCFTPAGLPTTVRYNKKDYDPMLLFGLSDNASEFYVGATSPYAGVLRAIESRPEGGYFTIKASIGLLQVPVAGITETVEQARKDGQPCVRITALLRALAVSPFTAIKQELPYFKPGKVVRAVLNLAPGKGVSVEKIVRRAQQAIIDDDFETLFILLESYTKPKSGDLAWKIYAEKIDDETLLQSTVSHHRASMYAYICRAHRDLAPFAQQKGADLPVDSGPCQGLSVASEQGSAALCQFFASRPHAVAKKAVVANEAEEKVPAGPAS